MPISLFWPYYILCFIVGAFLSSFIGLVVMRLPHQLKWRETPEPHLNIWAPASRCDHCRQRIPYYYLIPILGYLLCKGHCRQCYYSLPLYYPLIELLGGAIVMLLFYYYGLSAHFLLFTLLVFALLFLSWIDLWEHWLPAIVTLPLFWIGLLYSPVMPVALNRIEGAAYGFFISYGAMWLMSKIYCEDLIAGGDIALITVAGAWLGMDWFGYFLLLSCLIFLIYAIPARLKGIRLCPMGPALCGAFYITLILAH